jgi:hypothetical protein
MPASAADGAITFLPCSHVCPVSAPAARGVVLLGHAGRVRRPGRQAVLLCSGALTRNTTESGSYRDSGPTRLRPHRQTSDDPEPTGLTHLEGGPIRLGRRRAAACHALRPAATHRARHGRTRRWHARRTAARPWSRSSTRLTSFSVPAAALPPCTAAVIGDDTVHGGDHQVRQRHAPQWTGVSRVNLPRNAWSACPFVCVSRQDRGAAPTWNRLGRAAGRGDACCRPAVAGPGLAGQAPRGKGL